MAVCCMNATLGQFYWQLRVRMDSMSTVRLSNAKRLRWARQDSNLGPTDYESAALTN
jgi:hypothetical protein